MKRIGLLICLGALAACEAVPQEPIVASFNDSSVGIIRPAFATNITAEMLQARAEDICRRGPNRRAAERVSQRTLPDFQGTEYLFLCLN